MVVLVFSGLTCASCYRYNHDMHIAKLQIVEPEITDLEWKNKFEWPI